jgi:hypothetical protein
MCTIVGRTNYFIYSFYFFVIYYRGDVKEHFEKTVNRVGKLELPGLILIFFL